MRELITNAMAHSSRILAHQSWDHVHKPEHILEFFGIHPGMRVAQYMVGSGYYIELMSHIVGPQGEVVAYVASELSPEDLHGSFARVKNLPNVRVEMRPFAKFDLAPDAHDFVLFDCAYHARYFTPGMGDYFKHRRRPHAAAGDLETLRMAVPINGRVGVIENVAPAGSDPFQSAMKTQRLDPAVVRSDFESAVLEFEDECDVLRNKADDHGLSAYDSRVRGPVDRIVYRFRRWF